MILFDDEYRNIKSGKELGIYSHFIKNGLKWLDIEEALQGYDAHLKWLEE